MPVDLILLKTLMEINKKDPPKYLLCINDATYPIESVSITNSPTPVNEPTTRGGVYFSDTFAYKMKGVIGDLSIVPLLSDKMLGPNTEFDDLKIITQIKVDGNLMDLQITTNLTNSVQTPNSIELSMIIINIKSI